MLNQLNNYIHNEPNMKNQKIFCNLDKREIFQGLNFINKDNIDNFIILLQDSPLKYIIGSLQIHCRLVHTSELLVSQPSSPENFVLRSKPSPLKQ